jgi:hypothetical protein
MPRSRAVLWLTINNDQDFRALGVTEQWLYTTLLRRPDLNHAGVLPLNTRQWARCAAGTTVEEVEKALAVLADRRYVIVDWDTDECLIRTLIRNDGVWREPHTMINAARLATQVESPTIRATLAVEIRKVRSMLSPLPQGATPNAVTTRCNLSRAIDSALDQLDGPPPDDPSARPHMGSESHERTPPSPPEGTSNPSAEYGMPEGIDDPLADPKGDPCGEGEGEGEGVPVLEMETFPPSACPPRAHAHTRARGESPPDPKEPTTAPVVEAHRPIGVIPPEPVTYSHDQPSVDPDVARASTLTHGYLRAEPMALYERVQPVVLRAVQSGRYGHDEIATALGRLARDNRSVTVETLRIELAGQPPARAAPRSRSGRSGSASAYLAAVTDDPEPDPEPWRST